MTKAVILSPDVQAKIDAENKRVNGDLMKGFIGFAIFIVLFVALFPVMKANPEYTLPGTMLMALVICLTTGASTQAMVVMSVVATTISTLIVMPG